MIWGPRWRLLFALLLLPIGLPALALWGAGYAVRAAGVWLWMFCHRICREPGCRCAECQEFA